MKNKEKMLKLAKAIIAEIEAEDIDGVQIRQIPAENKLIMGDTLSVTVTLKPEESDYLAEDHSVNDIYYQ